MTEQELIARLVRKLPANAANHDTVYLSAVVADFLMEVRQHDKDRYVAAAKAQKWSEEYDLNSHQQSENRAIDRVIAAIEGASDGT
jgi:hypothetical protein